MNSNLFVSVACVDTTYLQDSSIGNTLHAMTLDTIKDGNFVFKNTYAENKQVTIPMEDGPLEFFYLHIELTKDAEDKLLREQARNYRRSFQFH